MPSCCVYHAITIYHLWHSLSLYNIVILFFNILQLIFLLKIYSDTSVSLKVPLLKTDNYCMSLFPTDVLCVSAWDFLLSFYIVTPVGGDKLLSLS